MNLTRRLFLKLAALLGWWRPETSASAAAAEPPAEPAQPFGLEFPSLDSLATGQWWTKTGPRANPPPPMDVPRDQVVAFALYTHDRGVLKLTAQLYPLKPGEPREARLEFRKDGEWSEVAVANSDAFS